MHFRVDPTIKRHFVLWFGSQPSILICLLMVELASDASRAPPHSQSSSDLHELNEQLNAEFGGSSGGPMSEAERDRLEALYEERIQLRYVQYAPVSDG
jgi:hypothetical protein